MQDLKSEVGITGSSFYPTILGQPSSPEISARSTLVSVLPDFFLTQGFLNCSKEGFQYPLKLVKMRTESGETGVLQPVLLCFFLLYILRFHIQFNFNKEFLCNKNKFLKAAGLI